MIKRMLPSILLYLGLLLTVVGLVALLRPSWRRHSRLLIPAGLALVVVTMAAPAREKHATGRASLLDEFLPVRQFEERHSIRIAASPERVFDAVRKVSANEIFLFRTLTAIRRAGCAGPESIINAPERKPILDVATQTTFVTLADAAPRELVVGTIVSGPRNHPPVTAQMFGAPLPPGYSLAAMNFVVQPDGKGGSLLTTETRVFANSARAARRFARYWRVILPGSDIIRRSWLQAIKRRAEQA
jgi:hypothetical protein